MQLFFFLDKELEINGCIYFGIDFYICVFFIILDWEGLFELKMFNIVYGDFFFVNIFYDIVIGKVVLVDLRGEFGEKGIYGDNLYEWVKLVYSIDGQYDFIINDWFDLFIFGNKIDYCIYFIDCYVDICKFFYDEIVGLEDVRKVKII